MRKIPMDSVLPGMRLARTIFNTDGRILLASGTLLKESYIERLINNKISEVYIDDEISKGVEINDVICQETKLQAKLLVKKLMENYAFSHALNVKKIGEIVGRIIDELLENNDIIVNLSDIKLVDDYTFEHSVNVCILSLVTGIGLGYNPLRLMDLGVGAILHDIGKLRISEKILKKPSQLTNEEFEEIKKHTVYGYEILKDKPNISMISAFIAFAHHERYDGSGYPLNLKGENIHQCARIVAVADVYDALTSDRVYRKKLRPHEVIEYITSLGSQHFDKEIVECFVKYIAVYPVGTGVVLNTQETGLVVRLNPKTPARPVIRIIYDKDKKKLKNFYEIDLSKDKSVYVSSPCEIQE